MRLAHKRKVQAKLQKRIKAMVTHIANVPKMAKPVAAKPAVEKKVSIQSNVAKVSASNRAEIVLTPKQQQVFDIVAANADGINPKAIGLAAGQEEAKAASWAAGALKKLLEENLVAKEPLAGNKVIYRVL
ncbi:MarR family transcriptional regulator [Vibrio cincinnatiensis]|uniref:MarR family transcriptional regulator n=1 Tax=Vibrio cincinnatiensis TaxID=675 RepID=UPI001EE00D30|nr:MarR family transcriptional regulator [Vibrio cincinnatiensis]MCG3725751.1 MarR family transcriptional regulator [Vibrio cincinnatiensis]